MDFILELKNDLANYEKTCDILYENEVFIFEERREIEHEIKRLKDLLTYLGERK